MVEVVDRHFAPGPGVERGQRGRAARLVREPGPGCPEHRSRRDRGQIDVFGRDVHVRRLRLAVEEDRKTVRRGDLAEDEWRAGGRGPPAPTPVPAPNRPRAFGVASPTPAAPPWGEPRAA